MRALHFGWQMQPHCVWNVYTASSARNHCLISVLAGILSVGIITSSPPYLPRDNSVSSCPSLVQEPISCCLIEDILLLKRSPFVTCKTEVISSMCVHAGPGHLCALVYGSNTSMCIVWVNPVLKTINYDPWVFTMHVHITVCVHFVCIYFSLISLYWMAINKPHAMN